MGNHKILSACLTYDSWVRFIFENILTDCFPDMLENTCGACEMDSRKIRMVENNFSSGGSIYKDQVDHAIRYTGFFENLHQYIGRIDLSMSRLPNHRISHQGSGSRQVASNSSKVERSQGKYETFQWPLLYPVPNAISRNGWLLGIDFHHIFYIEAQKVNKLTGGINFGLKSILGLT